MRAPTSLRKPDNWQDFETVCKKLWGEIWRCEGIKKNGRSGQVQSGVDVYGKPEGKNGYYGIQCKGKDDYTHKQLKKAEIDAEINKARKFEPPLLKFYFATTAEKDVKIEEYIRKKNIESQNSGSFEIDIYSWKDIVELMEENENVLNWYVQEKYKYLPDVSVTFENNQTELTGSVLFCHRYIHHRLGHYDRPIAIVNEQIFKRSKSYFSFKILFRNIGRSTIEHPKLILDIVGDYLEVTGNIDWHRIDTDVTIESNKIVISPTQTVLVRDDHYMTDHVFIKPMHHRSNLTLNWKFLSNGFSKEGRLKLDIEPKIIRKDETVLVQDPGKLQAPLDAGITDFYE